MSVIIGVDSHEASHTAAAIGGDEREVSKVTIRATRQQTAKLLAWAEPFAERTWAIESAGGLGYLLAQQLVDAGEVVLDVPPTLAPRVRVLRMGCSEKNDPNSAFSMPSPPCARMVFTHGRAGRQRTRQRLLTDPVEMRGAVVEARKRFQDIATVGAYDTSYFLSDENRGTGQQLMDANDRTDDPSLNILLVGIAGIGMTPLHIRRRQGAPG